VTLITIALIAHWTMDMQFTKHAVAYAIVAWVGTLLNAVYSLLWKNAFPTIFNASPLV